MTNLTEQWKKGELPNGMYYIEFKDGDIAKDVYAFGSWGNINEHFLRQVLAPVPSYKEWQAKLEENAQLKELLKECRKSFNKLKGDTVWYPYEVDECIAKIDEALK